MTALEGEPGTVRWVPFTVASTLILVVLGGWAYWVWNTAIVTYTPPGTVLVDIQIRLELGGSTRDLVVDPFSTNGREPIPLRLELTESEVPGMSTIRLRTVHDCDWEFDPAVFLTSVPRRLQGVQLWRAEARHGAETYINSVVAGRDDDPTACTVINLIPRRCNREGRRSGYCRLQRTQFGLCEGGEIFVTDGDRWELIEGLRGSAGDPP